MLPLRYALTLAFAILLLCGFLALESVGFRRPLLYENLSVSAEKYGLQGYAVAARLAAARRLAGAAAASGATPGASKVAAEASADDYAYAASLLAAQGAQPEAMAALRSALRVAFWRRDLQARLLEAQVNQGDRPAARRAMDLAYRHNDPYAQLILAKLYTKADRGDDAAACLSHAAVPLSGYYDLRMTYARHLLSVGAPKDAARHAREALLLARTYPDRMAATELLRASGGEVPPPFDVAWSRFLEAYSLTVLVLLGYLLLLISPWLLRRLRGTRRRLAEWHAGLGADA